MTRKKMSVHQVQQEPFFRRGGVSLSLCSSVVEVVVEVVVGAGKSVS